MSHYQAGDSWTIFISWPDGTTEKETVRIKNIYTYPDGSMAYGFYSRIRGRCVLRDCDCAKCLQLSKKRRNSNEYYMGDSERGVLIKL